MLCLICVGVSVSVLESRCSISENLTRFNYLSMDKRRNIRPPELFAGNIEVRKKIIVISIEWNSVLRMVEREREEYNIFGAIVLKINHIISNNK